MKKAHPPPSPFRGKIRKNYNPRPVGAKRPPPPPAPPPAKAPA